MSDGSLLFAGMERYLRHAREKAKGTHAMAPTMERELRITDRLSRVERACVLGEGRRRILRFGWVWVEKRG